MSMMEDKKSKVSVMGLYRFDFCRYCRCLVGCLLFFWDGFRGFENDREREGDG
jgi:hypothetical protein